MTASFSEDVGVLWATVPFYVDPILLEMEGGRYVVPFLPDTLADLVTSRCGDGRKIGGRDGCGGISSVRSDGNVGISGSGSGGGRGGGN